MSASVINSNLMAANVANNLNSHYSRLAISTQRLSTGLRVNSAADDAAGLAIRELMRSDIAAGRQGIRNANDAVSLLQVADGALAVIDEKLIRMKELAEQAATGTYDSTQRLMIHSEYVAMAEEIDRIARATDFNGIKLLDGSLSGRHDGTKLNSTGKMKIHFGTANDSAEDYYYVSIGDCTVHGLGLSELPIATESTTTRVPVTTYIRDPKTFKPVTSYVEYTDPDTGNKYYKDDDYYFSDLANPWGTALDWETDGALIEKLRMEPATETSYIYYTVLEDPLTGDSYYSRGNNSTITRDPHNQDAQMLDPNNADDAAIITRLRQPVSQPSVRIETKWLVYELASGKRYYTCDNGRTYAPDINQPSSNLLDSRNAADRQIISQFEPVMTEKKVSLPYKNSIWYVYKDPVNPLKTYWSSDGGKTFTGSISSADMSPWILNPDKPADKAIIDRLQPKYVTMDATVAYGRYRDPVDGTIYYTPDYGQNFVTDYRDAANTAFTDPDVISRLEPVFEQVRHTVRYETYEDATNPQNKYYSRNGGKTFFSDLMNPQGSELNASDPGYAAIVGNLIKLDVTTDVERVFIKFMKPNNGGVFFSCDNGQTFYNGSGQFVTVDLDASNPADRDTIASLIPITVSDQIRTPYVRYTDPVTKRNYFSRQDGPRDQFVSSWWNVDDIVLDKANPDQKIIIDRLVPDQDWDIRAEQGTFPDIYYIYEDPASGTIYYKPEPSGLVTSRPNDPYNSKYALDPANPAQKQILDRLRPIEDVTEETKYVDVTIPGGVTYPGLSISTQQAAQMSLVAINNAIVSKDRIRAHLGALQNRLENTVANLGIQAENLQVAESRISDTDVAREMTMFVRSQILTQSAVAMLGQANSFPHMMARLLNA